ncbi:Partner of Y14 and mago [Leucoagaricus sp. SymC.cos]|nr:Partner of Y14 and mago [Leucoagaricus sp. SymC.cos]
MSRPPINPEKSNAGIIVDPHTLERVIPESRRADGSIRKQQRVRPGFTPQEDVKRFRGTRQAQMDANTLPKGHILGWIAPSSASQPAKPMSKSAKKNAKRKEKRDEKRAYVAAEEPVRDNWEDDEEEDSVGVPEASETEPVPTAPDVKKTEPSSEHTADKPNSTTIVSSKAIKKLAADLEKLNIK